MCCCVSVPLAQLLRTTVSIKLNVEVKRIKSMFASLFVRISVCPLTCTPPHPYPACLQYSSTNTDRVAAVTVGTQRQILCVNPTWSEHASYFQTHTVRRSWRRTTETEARGGCTRGVEARCGGGGGGGGVVGQSSQCGAEAGKWVEHRSTTS